MKAVIAATPGGPDVLTVVQRPDPEPGAGDVLVRVRATAVNRADVLQREGHYPPPPGAPDVLGLEVAGEVLAVGATVMRWQPGDRVFAVVAGGGNAELAVVPADVAMPIPDRLDWHEAAAVPEVFTTAYDNVFTRGGLTAGETLLVHGGSGGVGTAATQLAVRAGCRVLATASTPEKLQACRLLGADAGIDYTTEDFVDRVSDLTDGRGVDVILDVVGARYLAPNLEALATEGRLVIIGLQGGASAEIDLRTVMGKRLRVMGSTLRARSAAEKAVVARRVERDVLPGFSDGSLRPVIDRVLPLDEVAEAHRAMGAGEHVGKIVLSM